jgi:hypothetical protein
MNNKQKPVPVTFEQRFGVYSVGETAGFDRKTSEDLVKRGIARAVTLDELRKKYPKEDVLTRVAVLKGGEEPRGNDPKRR